MSRVKKIEAKLYVADGPADAHLLRGLLESEGLTAFVRDDGMVPLQAVGFFKMETRPSVWVLADDEAQHERAQAIADGYRSGKRRPAEPAGDDALPVVRRDGRGPVHGLLELLDAPLPVASAPQKRRRTNSSPSETPDAPARMRGRKSRRGASGSLRYGPPPVDAAPAPAGVTGRARRAPAKRPRDPGGRPATGS